MDREEKNALSRQRILDAAAREFSEKGYVRASLNSAWAQNGISKGIIYHYFKDKDELYLLCVTDCFERLSGCLQSFQENAAGPAEQRLRAYFDARLRYFAENPLDLGLFIAALLDPPDCLRPQLAKARANFDALNVSVLTGLLESAPLRPGLTVSDVIEDFTMYMDYFNMRFRERLSGDCSPQSALHEHEEQAHRQLEILLYGVLDGRHEK